MSRPCCPTCGHQVRQPPRNDAPLPRVQRAAYEAIRELIRRGYPPSVQEIAAALGVARSVAQGHVAELIRKDYVMRVPGVARSLQITRVVSP